MRTRNGIRRRLYVLVFFLSVLACGVLSARYALERLERLQGRIESRDSVAVVDNSADSESIPDVLLQTQVATAKPSVDENGIPFLEIENVGRVRHPVTVALYALGYAGRETFVPGSFVSVDRHKFRRTASYVANSLKETPSKDWVWYYPFDNTYNDVVIRRPWFSGFGQALGIEVLVASFEMDGNRDHLEAAERAACVLFRPIAKGGLLFQKGDDVFFEEIANNADNPPHVLNGHLRVLIALDQLYRATGKPTYANWRDRGLKTLERWLPLYDTGYWLRYDLNLQKRELAFRLVNESGNHAAVAIDKMALIDPRSDDRLELNIGSPRDNIGPVRIAGRGWSRPTTVRGRRVRFVQFHASSRGMLGQDAYVYLKLPGKTADTLRMDSYVLELTYLDCQSDRVSVEMKSIAPGPGFRRVGTFLCWGENRLQRARLEIPCTQFGWWVGPEYGRNNAMYLERLARIRSSLQPWAAKARAYYRDSLPVPDLVPAPLPSQITPAVATKPR